MKINPALSGTTNVLGLIAAANPKFRFTETQVAVSNPRARDPDAFPYNSVATITGKIPGMFENPTDVYYNRRSIMEATDTPVLIYDANRSTTFDEVLTKICEQLHLVKSQVELANFRTPQGVSTSIVTLKPIKDSSLYYPTQQDFYLRWVGDDIQDAVAAFYAAGELHKLLHVTMAAPGYY